MIRFAMLLLPALLLTACGSGKTDERNTAAGTILPGSASDAMLQTDRLQSEAPLTAPKVAGGEDAKPGEKGAATSKAREPEAAASRDAEPAAAPAAPPIEAPAP